MWHKFIRTALGAESWVSASIEFDGIVTFVASSFTMTSTTPKLFPPFDEKGKPTAQGKAWRKCLQACGPNQFIDQNEKAQTNMHQIKSRQWQ